MRLEFTFSVGERERHIVHFSFDQVWGTLAISVDGIPKIKDLRLLPSSLTKEYRFTVGEKELHEIAIVKERKLVFAGFRSQTCRVFIDGSPAGEYRS